MRSTEKITTLYEDIDNEIMSLYGLSSEQKEIIRITSKNQNAFIKADKNE